MLVIKIFSETLSKSLFFLLKRNTPTVDIYTNWGVGVGQRLRKK